MVKNLDTLNEVYSSLSVRRRYEVWFLRVGLADGSGAWWFRYLLMNPGRGGCSGNPRGMPVQVWATWFPHNGSPQSFIQGFSLEGFGLSPRGKIPFKFCCGKNQAAADSCRGKLEVDGHRISWDLHYRSTFHVPLSNKGWIGFSRSPHSDGVFSGSITLDGNEIHGDPLGFGVQGHNCGYRHRDFWRWGHAYLLRSAGRASTLEALTYEMPFGLIFRKAVLWHDGKPHTFRNLSEAKESPNEFAWSFHGSSKDGLHISANFHGEALHTHRLPYLKTNCSGTLEVANNSLASASVCLQREGRLLEKLSTEDGAVLEKVGSRR